MRPIETRIIRMRNSRRSKKYISDRLGISMSRVDHAITKARRNGLIVWTADPKRTLEYTKTVVRGTSPAGHPRSVHSVDEADALRQWHALGGEIETVERVTC